MDEKYGISVNLRRTGFHKRPSGTPFQQISDFIGVGVMYYATWASFLSLFVVAVAMFIVAKVLLGWDNGYGMSYMILPTIVLETGLFLLLFQVGTQSDTRGVLISTGIKNMRWIMNALRTSVRRQSNPVRKVYDNGIVVFKTGDLPVIKIYRIRSTYNISMFDSAKTEYVRRHKNLLESLKPNQGLGEITTVQSLDVNSYIGAVTDTPNETPSAMIYKRNVERMLQSVTSRQQLQTYAYAEAKSPEMLEMMLGTFETGLQKITTSYQPLSVEETRELIKEIGV